MAVYFVVNSTITNAAKLEEYVQAAIGTLGTVPVKLLALDTESETIEGTPAGSRTVILEFETKDDFQTWYKSPEYQAIIDMRLSSTEGFGVLVNGVEDAGMAARIAYDEFGLFHENAAEFGLAYPGPPTVRREPVALPDGRRLSALVWGDAPAELVLVHGGAQNAHTWDTVALALGRPLVAVDLPGHGHSDDVGALQPGQLRADSLAADVAVAIRALAPDTKAVVGMSLGGMTSMCLAGQAPELVRRLVLVDVTPGVTAEKAKAITDFVNGPATFPDFDAILARTVEHNPTRTVSSLRRGILHNAVQLDDGSWVWRHRRHSSTPADAKAKKASEADTRPDYGVLWDRLAAVTAPVLLVRGMRPQSVVDDKDEAEFLKRVAHPTVARVPEAGHSVQGDDPLELTRLIEEFVFA